MIIVYYIKYTNTSCNCIQSMANINKINAAGALLWSYVGDIIKNTESDMAVRVLPVWPFYIADREECRKMVVH